MSWGYKSYPLSANKKQSRTPNPASTQAEPKPSHNHSHNCIFVFPFPSPTHPPGAQRDRKQATPPKKSTHRHPGASGWSSRIPLRWRRAAQSCGNPTAVAIRDPCTRAFLYEIPPRTRTASGCILGHPEEKYTGWTRWVEKSPHRNPLKMDNSNSWRPRGRAPRLGGGGLLSPSPPHIEGADR